MVAGQRETDRQAQFKSIIFRCPILRFQEIKLLFKDVASKIPRFDAQNPRCSFHLKGSNSYAFRYFFSVMLSILSSEAQICPWFKSFEIPNFSCKITFSVTAGPCQALHKVRC